MFIVIKKDLNEKTGMAQIRILGIFTTKSDAFFTAQHHCAIDFEIINDDAHSWSKGYDKYGHRYLVEVWEIERDRFDELEIFTGALQQTKLGYAFTW